MNPFKLIGAAVFAIVVLIFVMSSARTVDETERAVVIELGNVTGTLQPGFHLVNPFTTQLIMTDVTVQGMPISDLAYSKDGQIIEVQSIVNYQVPSGVVEALYKDVQNDHEARYVLPRARQAVKEVISRYTAQELIDNRNVLPVEATQTLGESLEKTGIYVESFVVANLDFDDAYERAITNKQVQEQEALTQANITAQEEEKKNQAILRAEAVAEKTRLEVFALSTGGEDIIEKIRAEAQLELAKNWNGVMPTHMYAGSPFPIIDIQGAQ
jgi:regulator of protease activity HflC (stomatin/prohibitin superfamily)